MTTRPYDLEERLIRFGGEVCRLCDGLRRTATGRHVADQLMRSGTAPFANYGEAQAAESRRDFVHKLRIVLKELRESRAWLKFICQTGLAKPEAARECFRECDELVAIFVTSVRTASQ